MQLSSNEVLLNTKGQYMKESNILEANATIKQQQKELLLNTKGLYMKESNIVVDNVTIKQLQSNLAVHKRAVHEGLKFPCGQCKHQSTSKGNLAPHNRANILAGNDTIKQQEKVLLFNKKRAVHEGVKYPCRQCNHQATSKSNLARHKRAAHDGVRF